MKNGKMLMILNGMIKKRNLLLINRKSSSPKGIIYITIVTLGRIFSPFMIRYV